MLAVFTLRHGRTADGLAVLDALGRSSDANVVHAAKSRRAEVYLRLGRLDEAQQLASEAVAGPGLTHSLSSALTLARTLQKLGRPAEALRTIDDAIARRGPTSFPQFEVGLESMRAELAEQLGLHQVATESAQRALRVAETRAAAITGVSLRTSFVDKLHLSTQLRALAARR
jgi:tetratricopeptide (TPR) repeat protein